jgi:hypothetical protein
MSIDARRRVADQVLVRMRDRGFPLDHDTELVGLIDRWAAGEMEMDECYRQYLALIQGRNESFRTSIRTLGGPPERQEATPDPAQGPETLTPPDPAEAITRDPD